MAPCDKVRWHRLERAKGPELLCVVWWSAAREAAGGPKDPRGADPRLYLPEGRLPGTRHGPSFGYVLIPARARSIKARRALGLTQLQMQVQRGRAVLPADDD